MIETSQKSQNIFIGNHALDQNIANVNIDELSKLNVTGDVNFYNKTISNDYEFPIVTHSLSNQWNITSYDYGNGQYSTESSSGDAYKLYNEDFWLPNNDYFDKNGNYKQNNSLNGIDGAWNILKLPLEINPKYISFSTESIIKPKSWIVLAKKQKDDKWAEIDRKENVSLQIQESENDYEEKFIKNKFTFTFDNELINNTNYSYFAFIVTSIHVPRMFEFPPKSFDQTNIKTFQNLTYGNGTYALSSSYPAGKPGYGRMDLYGLFLEGKSLDIGETYKAKLDIRNFESKKVEFKGKLGHFIDLQLPRKIFINKYELKQTNFDKNHFEWFIFIDNNDDNWIEIDHQKDTYTFQFDILEEKLCKRVRIFIVNIDGDRLDIESFRIFGREEHTKCRFKLGNLKIYGRINTYTNVLALHDNFIYSKPNTCVILGHKNVLNKHKECVNIEGNILLNGNIIQNNIDDQKSTSSFYITPVGDTREEKVIDLFAKLNQINVKKGNYPLYVRIHPGRYEVTKDTSLPPFIKHSSPFVVLHLGRSNTYYDFRGCQIVFFPSWFSKQFEVYSRRISPITADGSNITINGLQVLVKEDDFAYARKGGELVITKGNCVCIKNCQFFTPYSLMTPVTLDAQLYNKGGGGAPYKYKTITFNSKKSVLLNSSIKQQTFSGVCAYRTNVKTLLVDNCILEGELTSTDNIIDNVKSSGIPRNNERYKIPLEYPPTNPKDGEIQVCKSNIGFDNASGQGVYMYEDNEWKILSKYDHSQGFYNSDGEVYLIMETSIGAIQPTYYDRGLVNKVIPRGFIVNATEDCLRGNYSGRSPHGYRNVMVSNTIIQKIRNVSTDGGPESIGSSFTITNSTFLDNSLHILGHLGKLIVNGCTFNTRGGGKIFSNKGHVRSYFMGQVIDENVIPNSTSDVNHALIKDVFGKELSSTNQTNVLPFLGLWDTNTTNGQIKEKPLPLISLDEKTVGNFIQIRNHKSAEHLYPNTPFFEIKGRGGNKIDYEYTRRGGRNILNTCIIDGSPNNEICSSVMNIVIKNNSTNNRITSLRKNTRIILETNDIFPLYLTGNFNENDIHTINEKVFKKRENDANAFFMLNNIQYPYTYIPNRLGIKTNDPDYELDVNGMVSISDKMVVGGKDVASEIVNVQGNISLTGKVLQSSDMRLKTDIKPINDVLSKIKEIKVYEYKRKDWKKISNNKDEKHIGLIAQELLEVFPKIVVNKDENDFLSINYLSIVPLLLKSIQELSLKIEDMKKNMDNINKSFFKEQHNA